MHLTTLCSCVLLVSDRAWGAQFFALRCFEGAPFRLSLKSMPLAKIICKRHFHMSGEMVPPQYSPSDTTSARSPLAVVQRAAVKERGHLTAALPYLAQTRLGEMDTNLISELAKNRLV